MTPNRKQGAGSSTKADSLVRGSLALSESLGSRKYDYKYSTSPLSEAAHADACTIVQ